MKTVAMTFQGVRKKIRTLEALQFRIELENSIRLRRSWERIIIQFQNSDLFSYKCESLPKELKLDHEQSQIKLKVKRCLKRDQRRSHGPLHRSPSREEHLQPRLWLWSLALVDAVYPFKTKRYNKA